MANAREIVDVERYTGLLVETDVQGWLEPLHSLFSAYYMLMFGPLVAATLVGLALRRRPAYAQLSRALLLAIAIASVVFVLFPAAPPRLVPELGIADTVGLAGSHDSGSFGGVKFNPYAAMPSMHVGWSLLVGITLFGVARRRWLKAAAAAHPAVMTVTVVATGNHYLLDAVAGRRHRALLAGRRATVREPRAGPALAARAAERPGAGGAPDDDRAAPRPRAPLARPGAAAPRGPRRRSRPPTVQLHLPHVAAGRTARRPATGAPAARRGLRVARRPREDRVAYHSPPCASWWCSTMTTRRSAPSASRSRQRARSTTGSPSATRRHRGRSRRTAAWSSSAA